MVIGGRQDIKINILICFLFLRLERKRQGKLYCEFCGVGEVWGRGFGRRFEECDQRVLKRCLFGRLKEFKVGKCGMCVQQKGENQFWFYVLQRLGVFEIVREGLVKGCYVVMVVKRRLGGYLMLGIQGYGLQDFVLCCFFML